MPKTENIPASDDIDDLLGVGADLTESSVPDASSILDEASQEEEKTPEQKRIDELEARLEALLAAQQEATAAPDEDEDDIPFADIDPDAITVHFLRDGFMAAGQTWYRGQAISVKKDSAEYREQVRPDGTSWLDLRNDPGAQYEKYGDHFYAEGPWPGRAWGDVTGITDPEERAAIQKAAKAEQRRGNTLPRLVDLATMKSDV